MQRRSYRRSSDDYGDQRSASPPPRRRASYACDEPYNHRHVPRSYTSPDTLSSQWPLIGMTAIATLLAARFFAPQPAPPYRYDHGAQTHAQYTQQQSASMPQPVQQPPPQPPPPPPPPPAPAPPPPSPPLSPPQPTMQPQPSPAGYWMPFALSPFDLSPDNVGSALYAVVVVFLLVSLVTGYRFDLSALGMSDGTAPRRQRMDARDDEAYVMQARARTYTRTAKTKPKRRDSSTSSSSSSSSAVSAPDARKGDADDAGFSRGAPGKDDDKGRDDSSDDSDDDMPGRYRKKLEASLRKINKTLRRGSSKKSIGANKKNGQEKPRNDNLDGKKKKDEPKLDKGKGKQKEDETVQQDVVVEVTETSTPTRRASGGSCAPSGQCCNCCNLLVDLCRERLKDDRRSGYSVDSQQGMEQRIVELERRVSQKSVTFEEGAASADMPKFGKVNETAGSRSRSVNRVTTVADEGDDGALGVTPATAPVTPAQETRSETTTRSTTTSTTRSASQKQTPTDVDDTLATSDRKGSTSKQATMAKTKGKAKDTSGEGSSIRTEEVKVESSTVTQTEGGDATTAEGSSRFVELFDEPPLPMPDVSPSKDVKTTTTTETVTTTKEVVGKTAAQPKLQGQEGQTNRATAVVEVEEAVTTSTEGGKAKETSDKSGAKPSADDAKPKVQSTAKPGSAAKDDATTSSYAIVETTEESKTSSSQDTKQSAKEETTTSKDTSPSSQGNKAKSDTNDAKAQATDDKKARSAAASATPTVANTKEEHSESSTKKSTTKRDETSDDDTPMSRKEQAAYWAEMTRHVAKQVFDEFKTMIQRGSDDEDDEKKKSPPPKKKGNNTNGSNNKNSSTSSTAVQKSSETTLQTTNAESKEASSNSSSDKQIGSSGGSGNGMAPPIDRDEETVTKTPPVQSPPKTPSPTNDNNESSAKPEEELVLEEKITIERTVKEEAKADSDVPKITEIAASEPQEADAKVQVQSGKISTVESASSTSSASSSNDKSVSNKKQEKAKKDGTKRVESATLRDTTTEVRPGPAAVQTSTSSDEEVPAKVDDAQIAILTEQTTTLSRLSPPPASAKGSSSNSSSAASAGNGKDAVIINVTKVTEKSDVQARDTTLSSPKSSAAKSSSSKSSDKMSAESVAKEAQDRRARDAYIDTALYLATEYPYIVNERSRQVNKELDIDFLRAAEKTSMQDMSVLRESQKPHQDGQEPPIPIVVASPPAQAMTSSGETEAWQRALQLFHQYQDTTSSHKVKTAPSKGSEEDDLIKQVRKSLANNTSYKSTKTKATSDDAIKSLIEVLTRTTAEQASQSSKSSSDAVEKTKTGGASTGDTVTVKVKVKGKDKEIEIPVRADKVTALLPTGVPLDVSPLTSPTKVSLEDESLQKHEAKLRHGVNDAFKDVTSGVRRNIDNVKEDLSDLKQEASSKVKGLKSIFKKTSPTQSSEAQNNSGNNANNGKDKGDSVSLTIFGKGKNVEANNSKSNSDSTGTDSSSQRRRKSVRIEETPDVYVVEQKDDGTGKEVIRLKPKQQDSLTSSSSSGDTTRNNSVEKTTVERASIRATIGSDNTDIPIKSTMKKGRHTIATSDDADEQTDSPALTKRSSKTTRKSTSAVDEKSEDVYLRITKLALQLNED